MSINLFTSRLRQAVLGLSWSACGAVALPLAGGLLFPTRTLAQTSQTVSGRVVSRADNDGLPGVTVLQKGTSNGVSTNSDGTFSLSAPIGSTLVVSSVGFTTQEVAVTGTSLKLTMVPDSRELNDVVVVGYGSVKKSDLTGSVASLKREELMIGNPLSIDRGLQGKVAGVQVTQNDGAPGSGLSIQIRGVNSFSGNTQPLYVIDGVPLEVNNSQSTPTGSISGNDNAILTTNALNFLRPADIESIEVLKDASATAIYGSRGANGVVIITTKKGVNGKDRVDVTLRTGFDQVNKRLKLLDAETYANYNNEAYRNADTYFGTRYVQNNQLPFPGYTDPVTGFYKPAPADFQGKGTNWQDVIFQTGRVYDANVTLSGGSDKGNYAVSGSYISQGGIIANSNFEQGGLRFNGARELNKWLSFETNTQATRSLNKLVKTGTFNTTSDAGVIYAALRFAPTYNFNQDNYTAANLTEQPVTNPYIYTTDVKNQNLVTSVFSSNSLVFKILPGLTARTRVGLNSYDARRNVYYPRTTYEGGGPTQGIATVSNYNQFDITSENILTYTKKLGAKHDLTAVGGYTYTTSQFTNQSNTVSGFGNDALQDNNLGAATRVFAPTSSRASTVLLSYLGRLNYTLSGKYLFTLTGRIDGSSKFARNKKYAGFGAAAFAWRAIDESFISGLGVFSDLKLRLSYGASGSQAIGPYQSLARLQGNTYPVNGQLVNGYAQVSPENPNLSWETTYQGDVGLDMAFFKDRLTFTTDYYDKRTENLLQNLTLPVNVGFGSILFNSGSVRNRGVEAALNVRAVDGERFKWTVGGNISVNRNQLLSLGAGKQQDFSDRISAGPEVRPFIYLPGQALGLIYGYQEDGIFQNIEQVKAAFPNADPVAAKKLIGEIRYKDTNGDGQVNDLDRTVIGNVNPKFVYGVNNTFNFKGFDLGIFLQGSVGNDILNYTHKQTDDLGKGGNTTQKAYDNRWTPDNPNATNPKAAFEFSRNLRFSDRYVESGTYFRIKTLSAGYNFEFKQYGIRSARLYASATNLFTSTNYSGYDPEVNAYGNDPSRRGVDLANYPNSRSYSVGINVGF